MQQEKSYLYILCAFEAETFQPVEGLQRAGGVSRTFFASFPSTSPLRFALVLSSMRTFSQMGRGCVHSQSPHWLSSLFLFVCLWMRVCVWMCVCVDACVDVRCVFCRRMTRTRAHGCCHCSKITSTTARYGSVKSDGTGRQTNGQGTQPSQHALYFVCRLHFSAKRCIQWRWRCTSARRRRSKRARP